MAKYFYKVMLSIGIIPVIIIPLPVYLIFSHVPLPEELTVKLLKDFQSNHVNTF